MSNRSIYTGLCLLAGIAAGGAWGISAFPGAEGWASETPGGRGGKVLVVSNNNADGAGSFMAAVMTKGPRIIVFRTSGVITLSGDYDGFELDGDYSNLTIAGQTSPGGITLTGSMAGGSIIWCYEACQKQSFHDGVFRFLRFRGSEANEDAVSLTFAHTFIFDHCDFSGGSDETQDFTHDSAFTLQWNSVANSAKCERCQTYGTLIAYNPTSRVTLHHNLWAHHAFRSPEIHWTDTKSPPNNGQLDYRNNLIYNVEIPLWVMAEGPALVSPLHMNIVSNYYKTGPQGLAGSGYLKVTADATTYISDNVQESATGTKTTTGSTRRPDPFAMPNVTTHSATDAYEAVLKKVGAWPRDAMTARTVNEVRTRSGAYGKTDDARITTGPNPPPDADLDGMPDSWESAMGLDPNSSADATGDHDVDGYTNVEEYINDLALARLCEKYHNPVYPIPSDWPDYDPSCATPLGFRGGPGGSVAGRHLRLSHSVYDGSSPFRMELAGDGPQPTGIVRILDARGKTSMEFAARAVVLWNGKDSSGRPMAAGAYLVQWLPKKGAAIKATVLISR